MNIISSLINQVRQMTLTAAEIPVTPPPPPPPVCDPNQPGFNEQDCVLQTAWDHYTKFMIGADGRPYGDQDLEDLDGDGDREEFVTFSETASYVLLRAAWQNDRATFDKVWAWTRTNLQRKNISETYAPRTSGKKLPEGEKDHLFAWRYFDKVWRGQGGVLVKGKLHDIDPATDADLDIAIALLSAHRKWGKGSTSDYKKEALLILKDIWDKETIEVKNRGRVLVGGAKQRQFSDEEYLDPSVNKQETVSGTLAGINTSYFRFADYLSILKEEDTGHRWEELFQSSQSLVTDSGDLTKHDIDADGDYVPVRNKTNLNPDWSALTMDGHLVDHPRYEAKLNIRHGGDAFRLEFQMARLRDLYPNNSFALHYLTDDKCGPADAGPYCFFKQELDTKGRVKEGYKIDGTSAWGETTKNTAATFVFFDKAGDRARAGLTYRLLMDDYNKDGFWGDNPRDYYDQNWAWMSLALARYGAAKLWDERAPRHNLVYLPSTFATLTERAELPDGFFHKNNAEKFVDDQREGLRAIQEEGDESLDFLKKNEENIENMFRSLPAGTPRGDLRDKQIKKLWPKIAEKESILWLINAGIAAPRPDQLAEAIKYFNKLPEKELKSAANRFWLSKLAMVMAGEMLDNPQAVAALNQPPFSFNGDCLGKGLDPAKPSKESKAEVYRKIYKYLLEGSDDPLTKGENLLMRAIIAQNQEKTREAAELFAKAEGFLKPLYDNKHPEHQKTVENYTKHLRERILNKFERPGRKKKAADDTFQREREVYKRLAEDISAAMTFVAQSITLRAGKLTDEDQEYKELTAAGKLINEAARPLTGLAYVAAKRQMAEVFARQGFILKSQKKPGYDKKFRAAETLLRNVIDWKTAYDNLVGLTQAPKAPKYLKQEAALASIWYAKLRAVVMGDEENARVSRKESVPQQLKEIEELIEKNLKPSLSDLREEPSVLGDAYCLIGSLYIRKAYLLKDLDHPDSKVKEAIKLAFDYLDKAAGDRSLSPTRVEAHFWQTKAHLFLADYAKDRQGELAKLALAENEFAAAIRLAYGLKPAEPLELALDPKRLPAVKEVKNSIHSNLLAAGGEIRLKQGDFKAAVPWLDKAIAGYDKNYDALLNLADIRNWQENYKAAHELYGRVLGSSQSARIRLRAELGKAEVAMHRERDFSPKIVAGLKKTFDEIVKTEPSGSYLILRAVEDLADAYREARDVNGKPRYGEVYTLAETMLKKPCSPRLAALLYLKWAEAAEWLKDTDDQPKLSAGEILKKARENKAVNALLAGKESLALAYQMLDKELSLRVDEKTDLFEDGAFRQKIVASEDAGLIGRYISDRVESATLAAGNSNDFAKLIGLISSYLDGKEPDLRELAKLNNKKEAGNASRRLVRKLRLQLADALLWDKQYEKAEKEYQIVLDQDEKKHPLPELDNAPIRAWALFGLAEVYRYGGAVRNAGTSKKFYREARDEAGKIKGGEETKNYLLARVYLGLAKLADQNGSLELDGKEVVAPDLLAQADTYKAGIYSSRKKAYAPLFDELRANSLVLKRDWKHPEVETSTAYYYNDQKRKVNEFRLGLTLIESTLFDLYGRRAELDARVRINTDFDRKSGSIQQAYYLGALFKPYNGLSLEADIKLGDGYLKKNAPVEFSYLRTPNLQAAVSLRAPQGPLFFQGLSSVVSTGLFFSGNNQKLNSYYGNISYNAGRDTNIAALQGLSVAAQFNRFAFPYYGGFPERTRLSFPSLFYEIGLGRLDLIRLKLEAAGFYERAVDYSQDGATAYPKHNLGFAVGGAASFNAWGYFGLKLGYRFEDIRQDVTHKYAAPAEPWLTNHQFSGSLNLRF